LLYCSIALLAAASTESHETDLTLLFVVAAVLLLALLAFVVLLRRMLRLTVSKPRKPTPTSSPWRESAKRMPMPESDIKEEP
jgi:hypothetical protein